MIAVIRTGNGPEVLLVHGGASPETTWSGLAHLTSRWTLLFAHRRGYPPSPPQLGGRQDFDVDALDLEQVFDSRRHVVAHSYGALGAVIAATRRPEQVRSLTLIEPALFLAQDDPDLVRFQEMSEEVLTHGLEAEPATLREFLKIAGAPVRDDRPLPRQIADGVRRAQGSRSPWEARPVLELLRDAGVPSLVASGGHHPAIDRMCDAVAAALGAEQVVAPGAGHFVAEAPGFAERLERFLISQRRTR